MNYADIEELQAVYDPTTASAIEGIYATCMRQPRAQRDAIGFDTFLQAFPDEDTFIQTLFWIRSKTPGELVLLRYNSAQRKLVDYIARQEAARKPVRVIILKPRQTGFSTLVQAKMAYRTITRPHFRSVVVAHKEDSAAEIFEMTQRFRDEMPFKPPLKTDRRGELKTPNDSKYTCLTAGSDNVGRALSCHWAHLSEFAFYVDAESLYYGLMQTIPKKAGTGIIIESTANGMANMFRELWTNAMAGSSSFFPLFVPWHGHLEYTVPNLRKEEADRISDTITDDEEYLVEKFKVSWNQLAWRRRTIADECANNVDLFKQEYPAWPDEAFLMSGRPVFDAHRIQDLLARCEEPMERGNLAWVD